MQVLGGLSTAEIAAELEAHAGRGADAAVPRAQPAARDLRPRPRGGRGMSDADRLPPRARRHRRRPARLSRPKSSAHLATCAACRQFRDETLALDGRAARRARAAAARIPQGARRRRRAASRWPRRWCSAAAPRRRRSGCCRPQTALAGEVVEHVRHESGSWDAHDALSPAELADVLRQAGVEFDASMPVVYAIGLSVPRASRAAPGRADRERSDDRDAAGAREGARRARNSPRAAISGVLLPAGEGSVAVLARDGDGAGRASTAKLVSGVRW